MKTTYIPASNSRMITLDGLCVLLQIFQAAVGLRLDQMGFSMEGLGLHKEINFMLWTCLSEGFQSLTVLILRGRREEWTSRTHIYFVWLVHMEKLNDLFESLNAWACWNLKLEIWMRLMTYLILCKMSGDSCKLSGVHDFPDIGSVADVCIL